MAGLQLQYGLFGDADVNSKQTITVKPDSGEETIKSYTSSIPQNYVQHRDKIQFGKNFIIFTYTELKENIEIQ